jgi:hypothetical protein
MGLTRAQLRLKKEAEKIAELSKVDFWNVEKEDKEYRTTLMELAINHMVVGAIVVEYALLDEIFSTLICKYYAAEAEKLPGFCSLYFRRDVSAKKDGDCSRRQTSSEQGQEHNP